MRRFELIEGSSSKFWEVELGGCDLTVRFGRIGTNGQTQTKTFADNAAAKKEHDKLVREKTGKGYGEVGVGAGAQLAAVSDKPSPHAATVPTATPPAVAVSSPIAPTSTVAPSATPAPATATQAIDWPSGGFQWTDELRGQLPVVRGVRVPRLLDGLALLSAPLVLTDDRHGFHHQQMAQLSQRLGRGWSPWNEADSRRVITREALAEPDREYWLELCAQAMAGSRKVSGEPYGSAIAGGALRWVGEVGVALHGLPFMLELALDLCRALHGNRRFDYQLVELLAHLRHAIAASDDAAHAAVVELLERQANSSPFDRLLRGYLCPHRSDWVLQSLADQAPDDLHMLASCVMPTADALAYLKSASNYAYYLVQPVLLQIHLHGDAAIDLLAHVMHKAQDKQSLETWLRLAERMQSPRMLAALAQGIEHKEVRATLDKLAQRWPAAVLKTAIEQALTSRSRLAEGWAVRMALREPAALAAVMPALDEGAHSRFASLLADLQRAEAAPEQLPPLLREPPWMRKARASELPTLNLDAPTSPESIEWTAQERARLAAHHPARLARFANTKPEDYLISLQISPEGRTRIMAGHPLEAGDFRITKQYFYGQSPELVLAFPEAAALALWNSYPAQYWNTWGEVQTDIHAILARLGVAALPGLGSFAAAHPEVGLAVAMPVDSPRLVPTALHALRNLKKAKAMAIAWLQAHAATAVAAALPLAFGKAKAERDDAQYGLRWLVSNGFEAQARAAAASLGSEVTDALQALLDADPLLVLPSRMPKQPSFFVAASFRRPELRDGGAALPVTATEHIGSMLAISKLEAPYAGLSIVREACTPESLAEFAWDLFEAWTAAGNPSKDSWAFTALGLLGNDETARRLAPKIREWPGEGGHQRAVTGLDLLAAIGSDVALMHLNGIASKVKFKALQDRAKEKIAAVAEARGFTAAELADRLVPDLGLDKQGTLKLDFGPRQFFVAFDETLKPFVKDAQGARLKDLPKPVKSDDAAQADAATERYKQIKKDAKAVASLQVTRLELAMIDRRRWSAAAFGLFFLEHPLMRHLASRLMWGVYGADGVLNGAFRVAEDWTLADAQDSSFTLPEDASVGIAHILEVPKPMQEAFGQVFADYKILQPFKQLGREVYALTDAEKKTNKITRYANKSVATGSVMGLVNRGWERGQAQDGGWVGWFSKAVGDGLQVDLELDPGTVVGDLSYEPKQKFPAITLRQAGTWDTNGLIEFERMHPILASEVLRDVELIAPFKE